ncbi:MAG: SPOR domain-containing protein [Spirochaetaceae bacterium]|jgi:DedD protein|nr:SPOR domain-containing protein [Spirochaetaceae bacterium]
MEKKKLLLVAVSVGVFLVIVVSAAILIFSPRASAVPEISYRAIDAETPQHNRSATTDPANIVKDDTYMGLQDPASASPIQESRIYINGSEGGAEPAADTAGGAGAAKTVINIPRPAAPAVPSASSRPAPAASARPATGGRAAAGSQTGPSQPAKTAVPAAPAPKKQYRDFWVQAGSFSTRERADGVKHTLDNKGISAIVTNQEINGNTYYRVRVGPYTSQNEADYWLAMIKSIDGFHDSQVWESQALR